VVAAVNPTDSNVATSDPTAVVAIPPYPGSFYSGPAGANNLLPPNGTYPSSGVWLGIAPGGTGKPFESGTQQQVDREAAIGRKLTIAHRFEGGCTFPTAHINTLVANGWIPMISWQFNEYADRVLAGDFNACIDSWARGAAAWGQPFFLRIFWEFNGTWFRYSQLSTGGLASSVQERDLWRYVVDRMKAQGLSKASFVWAVGAGHYRNGDAMDETVAYPGNTYVDWVAADGYNAGDWCGAMDHPHMGFCTFEEIFHNHLPENGITSNVESDFRGVKPYMVAEAGSKEFAAGEKAQWFVDARDRIKAAFPGLYAFVYFDIDTTSTEGCCNWRLDSSTSALAGFARMADDPYFIR
jgi:hypothetical protein